MPKGPTATLRQLQQAASAKGCSVKAELVGRSYVIEVTAPGGYCFSDGIHQQVTSDRAIPGGRGILRYEALDRLNESAVVPCAAPNCEWCGDSPRPDHRNTLLAMAAVLDSNPSR